MTTEAAITTSAAAPPGPVQGPRHPDIDLALSGGGFRATLFHLGVLRFLADAGLLRHVRRIASVSGGSITAAHLVANWPEYISDFDSVASRLITFCRTGVRNYILLRRICRWVIVAWLAGGAVLWHWKVFHKVAAYWHLSPWVFVWAWAIIALIAAAQTGWMYQSYSSLLQKCYGCLYRPLPSSQVPKWCSHTVSDYLLHLFHYLFQPVFDLLESVYSLLQLLPFLHQKESLLSKQRLNTLRNRPAPNRVPPALPQPALAILATSLSTGHLCWFDAKGFWWLKTGDQPRAVTAGGNVEHGLIPLPLAVAASSAFPPFFNPVKVDHADLSCPKNAFPITYYLTDGGVYDNLGVEHLMPTPASSNEQRMLIISDAEGAFDTTTDQSFRSLVFRTIRISDILMKRVSDGDYIALGFKGADSPGYCFPCRIGDVVTDNESYQDIDAAIQRRVHAIRTDLDEFRKEEVYYLLRHGYAVARNTMTRYFQGGVTMPPAAAASKWSGGIGVTPSPSDLRDSHKHGLRLSVFFRRTTWYITLLIVLMALLPGSIWVFSCYITRPTVPFQLTSSAEIMGTDVIKSSERDWLRPIIGRLTEEQAAEGDDKPSWIVIIQTEQFATRTFENSTPSFHLKLTLKDPAYQIRGGYGFRVRRDSPEWFSSLAFPRGVLGPPHQRTLTVDASPPDTAILLMVRITGQKNAVFPPPLLDAIVLEVEQ